LGPKSRLVVMMTGMPRVLGVRARPITAVLNSTGLWSRTHSASPRWWSMSNTTAFSGVGVDTGPWFTASAMADFPSMRTADTGVLQVISRPRCPAGK
jgi:hypothetical protein